MNTKHETSNKNPETNGQETQMKEKQTVQQAQAAVTAAKVVNGLNVSAHAFNIEGFDEVVKNLRNTRRRVVEFGTNFDEVQAEFTKQQAELKKAMEAFDYDAMREATTKMKNLEEKLRENPVERVQKYDEAVNALVKFLAAPAIKPEEEDKEDKEDKDGTNG